MTTAFSAIPTTSSADDADTLLVRDESAGNERRITRTNLLTDYAKNDGSAAFNGNSITANTGAFTTADATELRINTGPGKLVDLRRHNASVSAPTLSAGAGGNVTASVSGLTINHVATVNVSDALPAGLLVQVSIRAADTLTFSFFNATGASISGAAYAYTAAFFRVNAA